MNFNAIKPETISLLHTLNEYLSSKSTESYVVGGFVRDILLERETADIDIAVAGDACVIAEGVAEFLGGRYVLLDDINKVARVILFHNRKFPDEVSYDLDFSSFPETIEKDLGRRDFTVNAMAIKLSQLASENRSAEIVALRTRPEDVPRLGIHAGIE